MGSLRYTGGNHVTAVHQNNVLIVLNIFLDVRIPVYVVSIDGDNRTFRSTIRREFRNEAGQILIRICIRIYIRVCRVEWNENKISSLGRIQPEPDNIIQRRLRVYTINIVKIFDG